jgi:damage-control phosphatase, subfamily I
MKTYFDCIPCFIRQALGAARTLDLGDENTEKLLRQTLELAQELDWTLPPPVIARDIHRLIRRITGSRDPYLEQKIIDTELALKHLPEIERQVAASPYPFLHAVKFSIAGNAIDLGAKKGEDIDIDTIFAEALSKPVEVEAVRRLQEAAADAGSVLFLADNCGEIVFDRPLLERIGADKLTVAVRGAPTINDATLDDAIRAGLTERFAVISNGTDTPGTLLDDCSPEFLNHFQDADLVISKGQGNYESLSHLNREVFYLFMAKCNVVAGELGVPIDSFVIRKK